MFFKRKKKGAAEVTVVGRSDPKESGIRFVEADLSTVKAQTALASSLGAFDLILFTQGIICGPTRKDNGEGIEMDLAVSYLGRRVILDILREKGGVKGRVFIMGYPGDDLEIKNWNTLDETKYGLLEQHMNTIVANEALVLGYRSRFPNIEIFGLNPGLVQTGIRAGAYEGVFRYIGPVLELFISACFPSADEYAEAIFPALSADVLDKKVISFNPTSLPVRVNPKLTEQVIDQVWSDSEKLIAVANKKN